MARSRTHRLLRAVLVAASCTFAINAHAEGTADLRGLLEQTVVTTASKTKETGSNAPATSTTLTADDMRRYGIRTVDEAINFLSLGAVAYNPFYTPDVSVRGVGIEGDQGNHVLLLVDGHSMNDALYGAARFGRGVGLPLELIDHIEVILGPGSVLYGTQRDARRRQHRDQARQRLERRAPRSRNGGAALVPRERERRAYVRSLWLTGRARGGCRILPERWPEPRIRPAERRPQSLYGQAVAAAAATV